MLNLNKLSLYFQVSVADFPCVLHMTSFITVSTNFIKLNLCVEKLHMVSTPLYAFSCNPYEICRGLNIRGPSQKKCTERNTYGIEHQIALNGCSPSV